MSAYPEITREQFLKFEERKWCPDCNGVVFLEGPHGGNSVNIKCARRSCGSRFNICIVKGGIVFMERISEASPDRIWRGEYNFPSYT